MSSLLDHAINKFLDVSFEERRQLGLTFQRRGSSANAVASNDLYRQLRRQSLAFCLGTALDEFAVHLKAVEEEEEEGRRMRRRSPTLQPPLLRARQPQPARRPRPPLPKTTGAQQVSRARPVTRRRRTMQRSTARARARRARRARARLRTRTRASLPCGTASRSCCC
jgi:hypothetical protein